VSFRCLASRTELLLTVRFSVIKLVVVDKFTKLSQNDSIQQLVIQAAPLL